MSSSWCIDESSKSGKVYSKNLLQLSGNKNVSMNYVWVRTGGGPKKIFWARRVEFFLVRVQRSLNASWQWRILAYWLNPGECGWDDADDVAPVGRAGPATVARNKSPPMEISSSIQMLNLIVAC